MKKTLLSVGVLIENDKECIENCLEHIQKLREFIAYELIVGNLGSHDGSREIAARYADYVIDISWNGRIADAWNTLLEYSTGEWYLGVEADEVLDEHLDSLVACLKDAEEVDAVSVAIEEKGAVQWGESASQTRREIRVVRLSHNVRYGGDVKPVIVVDHHEKLIHLTSPLLHRSGTVAKKLEEQKYPYVYQEGRTLSLPFSIVSRMVREKRELPSQVFQAHSEEIDELVSCIQKHEKLRPLWVQWLKQQNLAQSLGMIQFYYQMVFSLLCTQNWEYEQEAMELIELFISAARRYLTHLYHPKCLNREQEWVMFPTLHHYSWRLVKAVQQMEQGDEYSYLYHLHQAKQAIPMLSGLVDFMMDHPPEKEDVQLQRLARQVREILSQYAADDPALVAIKSSPAYQKVEHLLAIDGGEHTVDTTVHEEPDQSLDEDFQLLMKVSSFEQQQEALEAIAYSYKGVSEDGQNILKDYWERNSRWGKDVSQVIQNISGTFVSHKKELEWLYQHLGDNHSKRVLLAVLCSWRFFDFVRLKNVREEQNDTVLRRMIPLQPEIIVDIGANTGDFFDACIKYYGDSQIQSYYGYETREAAYKQLKQRTQHLSCAKVYPIAVGAKTGVLHREQSSESHELQMVALDDHISEKITLLNICVDGWEQEVVQGCSNHIKKDAPRLIISIPDNFEDIWKLPKMLDGLFPQYQFYLRYQGNNLWPSKISLVAIPIET